MALQLFDISFSWVESILFCLFFVCFAYQLYFYLRYINGSFRKNKREREGKLVFQKTQEPVSIIICAKNEEENLRNNLPFVLEQNYPTFEIIVINDSSIDDTELVLNDFRGHYPNLKTTFIPVGAKNISTKKLGINLGVKAAKHDILLFTDADCIPNDKLWIAKIMRNFAPEVEFVLGYGGYLPKKGWLNRLITYDTLFIALQYMGMAMVGKAYMGVGRNLAYRKETFLKNNGFSSTINQVSGDDDLFVNKNATKKNIEAETSKESITWSEPKKDFKSWIHQKTRHLSVSNLYTRKSKIRIGLEPVVRGLFYVSFILCFIVGNLCVMAAATVLFLTRLAVQLITINRSSKYWEGHQYYTSLVLFDILLPLINLYILTVKKPFANNQKISWK